ncbi:MAG: Carboxy-terminal processing protease CtpB precursor [Lentisphaerae bacterium ADurb.BinA184]|nr:MAG: Carboxy-terminal processing protease CtpB precursor [Lentisphaerae bacterium ADurb.BinA184]
MPDTAARRHRLFLWLTAAALAANLAVGYRVYSKESGHGDEAEALEKLGVMMRVMQLIRQDYVDGGQTDYTSLIYDAMQGMVSGLDPYSAFMSPDEYEEMVDSTEGQFGGLGVVVTLRNGMLTVVAPMEGTPGQKAGLLPGDRIVEINGESTEDMKLSEAVNRLKGEPGTSVKLTLYRESTDETREVEIVRAIIEVASVKGARLLADGIGYVRLVQFDEQTAADLGVALAGLKEQGMTALILDLRSNPGGLLVSAVDVCSLFLDEKKLVVSTEGRQPSQKSEYFTGGRQRYVDLPIAILINKGSASAAEIVAGCLQDYKRAVLVGETSFGKGSVQNVIRLPDESALRLTTAMYYTPSHRVIHDNGIEPNIEVPLSADQIKALAQRQMDLAAADAPEPAVDPQLARALESLQSYQVFRSVEEK